MIILKNFKKEKRESLNSKTNTEKEENLFNF